MKKSISPPQIIAFHPEMKKTIYLAEVDSKNFALSKGFMAEKPTKDTPSNSEMFVLGPILNPATGWRLLPGLGKYIPSKKTKRTDNYQDGYNAIMRQRRIRPH